MIHGSTLCGADNSNRCLELNIDGASYLGSQGVGFTYDYDDA